MIQSIEIVLVVAMSQNRAIGKENQLIWHLPNDMRRFVSLTKGKSIIMGRKTFDSLPIKPLPKRTNFILTRNSIFDFEHPDVKIVSSIKEAINHLEKYETELMVIGGGEIYNQTIDIADRLEVTLVHDFFQGDTFFPEIDSDKWNLINKDDHNSDQFHNVRYSFLTYKRKENSVK